MAEKIYTVIKTFQIVTSKKITIEEGQKIPEDWFSKEFADPKRQIDILLANKFIKEVGAEAKTIDKMNKEELVAYAKEKGIEINDSDKKSDILDFIKVTEEEAKK